MSYSFNKQITVDHTQVPSTQTNFPVLISGTYSYLATVANSGGIQNTVTLNGLTVPADLIFTSDSLGISLLSWEISDYNPVTGEIEIWVNIPTLSSSIDTIFYMFYGNSLVTTYQCVASSTWNATYGLVAHLNSGANIYQDSTSHNSVEHHQVNTSVPAKINAGIEQVGTAAEVFWAHFGSNPMSGSFTLSCWLNVLSLGADTSLCQISATNGRFLNYGTFGTHNLSTVEQGVVAIQEVPYSSYINTFHKIDWVYDGTNSIVYIDGINVSSIPYTFIGSVNIDQYIGQNAANNDQIVDEYHVVSTNHSQDWITTEYNNQNSPSTFYSIGSGALTLSLSDSISLTDSLSPAFEISLNLPADSVIVSDSTPGSFSIQSDFLVPVHIPIVEQLVNQLVPANIKTYFKIVE